MKCLPASIFAAIACSVPLAAPAAQPDSTTGQQMIDAFEGTFGVHAGQRRNHIKGTCAAGEFVGTSDAAALSRSPPFTGKTAAVQHSTMINVPTSAASSPASSRDAIVAAKPDPKTGKPDPEKLKAYAASH